MIPVVSRRWARLLGAGTGAILLLALANSFLVERLGCNQTAHYAFVQSLDRGDPRIDPYQAQTCDKTYFHGHFYSNKAPGLGFAALPFYAAAHAVHAVPGNPRVAVWGLGLLWTVAAAAALLLLVRRVADELEPGYGTAAAVTLGLGTLLLPFANMFFAHALSALLTFASFVLVREAIRGERADLMKLGAAGLVAGLAVVVEYPNALVGAVLFVLCLAVARPRLSSAAAYGAGAVVGALPVPLFNLWAYGSPFHSSYDDVVFVQGKTGHDVVGSLNGLFGIGRPSLSGILALMLAPKGLLVLTPVLAVAAVGLVLIYRRGHRADALVCAAVTVVFVVYDSGYFAPFGGDGPGPRYLVPMLPFLALGLAPAYRLLPLTTIATAVVSALAMLVATATEPLLGNQDSSYWLSAMRDDNFTQTVLTYAGAGHGWVALAPFLLLVAASVAAAVAATPRPAFSPSDAATAVAALIAWAALAASGYRLLDTDRLTGLPHAGLGAVAAAGVLAAALVSAVALVRARTVVSSG